MVLRNFTRSISVREIIIRPLPQKNRNRKILVQMEGTEFSDEEYTLSSGDALFVYTDGVPESINTAEEQYGTDRMLTILNVNRGVPMIAMLADVKEDMDAFVGEAEQFDDITMMGFRYNGPQ